MSNQVRPIQGQVPDVTEAGRVLAQLDDWRAIMFVLIFIIVALLLFIFWREWVMSKERTRMQSLADSLAGSTGKVGDALSGFREQVAVMNILLSRVEAVLPRSKHDEPTSQG